MAAPLLPSRKFLPQVLVPTNTILVLNRLIEPAAIAVLSITGNYIFVSQEFGVLSKKMDNLKRDTKDLKHEMQGLKSNKEGNDAKLAGLIHRQDRLEKITDFELASSNLRLERLEQRVDQKLLR